MQLFLLLNLTILLKTSSVFYLYIAPNKCLKLIRRVNAPLNLGRRYA
jgi:hypothetical protein